MYNIFITAGPTEIDSILLQWFTWAVLFVVWDQTHLISYIDLKNFIYLPGPSTLFIDTLRELLILLKRTIDLKLEEVQDLPLLKLNVGPCTFVRYLMNLFLQQYEEQQKRNQEAEFTELVRDFLNPEEFYNACNGVGIDYFTGVPDSLLKGLVSSSLY